MKKIFCVILFGSLFLPLIGLAAGGVYQVEDNFPNTECGLPGPINYTVTYDGIVPCGRCLNVSPAVPARAWWDNECDQGVSRCTPLLTKFIPCTICHFFVMIDGIVDFILLKIVPLIATLMFIFGGIAHYQAGASPEKAKLAKSILTTAIIGVVLVYGSWLLINTILVAVGITDWTGLKNWFEITCAIKYKP